MPEELIILMLRAILAAIGVDRAKQLLDQEAVNAANAAADEIERQRGLK